MSDDRLGIALNALAEIQHEADMAIAHDHHYLKSLNLIAETARKAILADAKISRDADPDA